MARWIWPAAFGVIAFVLLLPTPAGITVAVGLLVLTFVLTGWTFAVRRGVSVRVHLPPRLVNGEHTDLEVTVANRSRLPASRIRVEVTLPSGGIGPANAVFEVALPGRSVRRVTSPVTAYRRGRWQPGPIRVTVADPLGLHRLTARAPTVDDVLVLPAVVPVRRLELPAVAPFAELPEPHALHSDPMSIVGVRPYQPGDPLRSIHWPATAAAGTLVRRETERGVARDLLLVLDVSLGAWTPDDHHQVEVAISVAASLLADALLVWRQPAGLITSVPAHRPAQAQRTASAPGPAAQGSVEAVAANLQVRASRSHLDAMLAHLATVHLHRGVPIEDLVLRDARRLQPGTTVAIVTGRPTRPLAAASRRLLSSGLAPVLVQVGPPEVLDRDRTVPTGGVPRLTVATDLPLVRLAL